MRTYLSILAFFRLYPRRCLISLVLIFGLLLTTIFASMTVVRAQGGVAPQWSVAFSMQQRIGFHSGDDWEPAITTDRFGHIYTLYKHYDVSGGQTCAGCDLHLLFQRSDDRGKTWSNPRPIAPIAVKGGQYDPQIVVDPLDGRTVWAAFLQNSNSVIDVVKSSDFGQTWSTPHTVSTQPPGLDKDSLVVRGHVVAVAYDDNHNTFASVSLDGGENWKSYEIFAGNDQFDVPLSAGGGIDAEGNLFFSWDSFDKAHSKTGNGPATLWVTKSGDGGKHWTRTIIDVSAAAPPCHPCGFAYLSSQMAMRSGADDTIYLLWNATSVFQNFTPERIYFSRSTNHGQSYSPRRQISDAPTGVEHCFPALAVGQGEGDVRLGWMDKRTGAWNVYYRSSTDGGTSFTAVTRVSGYVAGYPYLTTAGFALPYGDYFQMVVDQQNKTQMAFGEGPSYAGPGNIWVAHQL